MRSLTIAFLLLSSLVARSEEIPGLAAFAKEYWAAIRSQDAHKIFSFYDPKVFSDLSPAEADFMKEFWMKGYSDLTKKPHDSSETTSKRLPSGANPLPTWRWAAKPEFQIEIQTFRNVPHGKEGVTALVDLVIRRDGRYLIIRPVPPDSVLRKQLSKKNGQPGAAAGP